MCHTVFRTLPHEDAMQAQPVRRQAEEDVQCKGSVAAFDDVWALQETQPAQRWVGHLKQGSEGSEAMTTD